MSTSWPTKYELTKIMSTNWPKWERVDLSTNWLKYELTGSPIIMSYTDVVQVLHACLLCNLRVAGDV